MADQPSIAARIKAGMGQGMPSGQAASSAYKSVGADPKMPQPEANYRPADGPERCGTCQHFIGPDACEVVQGTISPDHVSDQYVSIAPPAEQGGPMTGVGSNTPAPLGQAMGVGAVPGY